MLAGRTLVKSNQHQQYYVSGLSHSQNEKRKEHSREETAVFSQNNQDVRDIPEPQMKINPLVTQQSQVTKGLNYSSATES